MAYFNGTTWVSSASGSSSSGGNSAISIINDYLNNPQNYYSKTFTLTNSAGTGILQRGSNALSGPSFENAGLGIFDNMFSSPIMSLLSPAASAIANKSLSSLISPVASAVSGATDSETMRSALNTTINQVKDVGQQILGSSGIFSSGSGNSGSTYISQGTDMSGVANALSGLGSTFQNYIDMINQQSQANNEWSAEQAQKQMDFQERMSSTAHQREIADLKASGLNPVLSAGGSGASTPSGAMGVTDTSNTRAITDLAIKAIDAVSNTAIGVGSMSSGSNNSVLSKILSSNFGRSFSRGVGMALGRAVVNAIL